MRVEWTTVNTTRGGQYVTMNGTYKKPLLCVKNLVMAMDVSILYWPILVLSYFSTVLFQYCPISVLSYFSTVLSQYCPISVLAYTSTGLHVSQYWPTCVLVLAYMYPVPGSLLHVHTEWGLGTFCVCFDHLYRSYHTTNTRCYYHVCIQRQCAMQWI